MPVRLATVLLLAASVGCGAAYESWDERECPPEGTTLTYENFAVPFFERECQWCHGSDARDRAGAPGEYIFDNHTQVARHSLRIYARAAGPNKSMPPGPDDPSDQERDQLAEWLVCGAPQ